MTKELKVRCRGCGKPFDARFDINDPMDYAFCPVCKEVVEINTGLHGQLKPKHVLDKRKKDKKIKKDKELKDKREKDLIKYLEKLAKEKDKDK